MKQTRKKLPDNYLLYGLILIIIGAGGIGYIPGKTAVITITFALVLAAGILTTALYVRSKKGRTVRTPSEAERIPAVHEKRKRYSQFAA